MRKHRSGHNDRNSIPPSEPKHQCCLSEKDTSKLDTYFAANVESNQRSDDTMQDQNLEYSPVSLRAQLRAALDDGLFVSPPSRSSEPPSTSHNTLFSDGTSIIGNEYGPGEFTFGNLDWTDDRALWGLEWFEDNLINDHRGLSGV